MKLNGRILLVDDERSMREMVSILLKRHGFEVITARSGKQALEILDQDERLDLVITDLVMDRGGGLEVLAAVKDRKLGIEVIVFTAFGTPDTAVEAMKQGAFDYIAKPFNVDEFMIVVNQAIEHRSLVRENERLRARVKGAFHFADIIGRSQAMADIVALCKKVADSMAGVLITGESGTGKEVIARALHFSSRRAEAPFLPINCGALPEQLMESELFGHVKGAFTGANQDKDGIFTAAKGGTVFLDEIGELPLALQVKLLRVLQEKTVRPVGASREIPVDIRVTAATNRDLWALTESGEFRQDLFFRLNVIQIALPPLRDRREDIPLLTEHLLDRLAAEYGTPRKGISPEAVRTLFRHDYPGNVRELSNILERAFALAAGDVIEADDLPMEISRVSSVPEPPRGTLPEEGLDLDAALAELERSLIEQALARTGGVRTKAAELLGVSFRSFRYRLSKLGIDPGDETVGD
jgi:two-component system response regulator PilR (NtrC family)